MTQNTTMTIESLLPLLGSLLVGLSGIGMVWWRELQKTRTIELSEYKGIFGDQIRDLKASRDDYLGRIQKLELENSIQRLGIEDSKKSVADVLVLNSTLQTALAKTQKELTDALELIAKLRDDLKELRGKFTESLVTIKELKAEILALKKY